MKVLVTGYTGQLGYDLVKAGKKRALDIVGISTKDVDLTDEQSVLHYVRHMKPDVIIHSAAYTAVDQAEDDKERCYDVNVNGTKYLALAAKEVNAKFVYVSTDYVFDGKGEQPFTETDQPNPIGQYGRTKYEGEQVVQALLDKWYIVRISWVFGMNGKNFIKTMLSLSETRDELNVVGDQYGSPTYTVDLSRFLLDLVQTDQYGIYHASNEGFCSWAEFAQEIFKQSGKNVKVNGITTDQYPTKAVRPKNSRMSKDKLLKNGFAPLPSWQDALSRYLLELNGDGKDD